MPVLCIISRHPQTVCSGGNAVSGRRPLSACRPCGEPPRQWQDMGGHTSEANSTAGRGNDPNAAWSSATTVRSPGARPSRSLWFSVRRVAPSAASPLSNSTDSQRRKPAALTSSFPKVPGDPPPGVSSLTGAPSSMSGTSTRSGHRVELAPVEALSIKHRGRRPTAPPVLSSWRPSSRGLSSRETFAKR